MTAQVARRGWLDLMSAVYGRPRQPLDLRTARGAGWMLLQEWRWPDFSVALRTVQDQDRRPMSSVLRVNADQVEVELRCAAGVPANSRVVGVLRTAGLLPCPVCAGLTETPAGRDGASELWTLCGCAPPSARPEHGWAEIST